MKTISYEDYTKVCDGYKVQLNIVYKEARELRDQIETLRELRNQDKETSNKIILDLRKRIRKLNCPSNKTSTNKTKILQLISR